MSAGLCVPRKFTDAKPETALFFKSRNVVFQFVPAEPRALNRDQYQYHIADGQTILVTLRGVTAVVYRRLPHELAMAQHFQVGPKSRHITIFV